VEVAVKTGLGAKRYVNIDASHTILIKRGLAF